MTDSMELTSSVFPSVSGSVENSGRLLLSWGLFGSARGDDILATANKLVYRQRLAFVTNEECIPLMFRWA